MGEAVSALPAEVRNFPAQVYGGVGSPVRNGLVDLPLSQQSLMLSRDV
ncbi:MAG: hypothetical protein ACI9OD_000336 [Limisphaerales bacterium]|jgi:hypothetical protein